jgi:lipid-A-disaccharide synthase
LAALAAAADAVGAVLPFEQEWFAARGLPVVPIGHPVVDRVFPDREGCRRRAGDRETVLVSSRQPPAEVAAHWPLMRRIALRLVAEGRVDSAVVAAVRGAEYPEPGVLRVAWERSREVMRASTAAIVKSGTTTLEATWAGTPHVLLYRAGRLSYEMVRRQRPFRGSD